MTASVLDLAYGFVVPSYQWMLVRSDAISARLQHLYGFAAALTIGAPVFGKAVRESLSANSGWFFAAAAVSITIIVIGLVANRIGAITVLNPALLRTLNGSESRKSS